VVNGGGMVWLDYCFSDAKSIDEVMIAERYSLGAFLAICKAI
jgi:hypothetical protein